MKTMKTTRIALLVCLLSCLPACGTVRAGIQGARLFTVAVLDDCEAAVDGVARSDWERNK